MKFAYGYTILSFESVSKDLIHNWKNNYIKLVNII